MSLRRAARVVGVVGPLAIITAVVMLGGVIGLFVWDNHGGNPPSLVRADDPVVNRARFTRVSELDGGALRVDPPSGSPKVRESQAIATFRAVSLPSIEVTDVVIGFGMVTLRADLTPNGQPVLSRQPSWVVNYYLGAVACLAIPSIPAHPTPAGRPAFILDATTGTHLIHYLSRGSYCAGPPAGPQARTANIGLLAARVTFPPAGPPGFEYFDGRVRMVR